MIQRIFISIKLPDKTKEDLSLIRSGYDLPVNWAPEDNLHITLLFLGAVNSENTPQIIKIIEGIVKSYKPFNLIFEKIEYGPGSEIPPRTICLRGPKNIYFEKLRKEIDQALKKQNLYYAPKYSADIKIHVTLGRVKKWEWARIEPEDRVPVDEDVFFEIPVNELLIMESKISPGKAPKYSIIETIPLDNS